MEQAEYWPFEWEEIDEIEGWLSVGCLMTTKAKDNLIIFLIIVSVRITTHEGKKRKNRVHYIGTS